MGFHFTFSTNESKTTVRAEIMFVKFVKSYKVVNLPVKTDLCESLIVVFPFYCTKVSSFKPYFYTILP